MVQHPLLRDVIDIKKSISTSDFVPSLAEATGPGGVRRALKDYEDVSRGKFRELLVAGQGRREAEEGEEV
jgi:hypothetical protein